MNAEQGGILAIEPECYRDWVARAIGYDADVVARAQSQPLTALAPGRKSVGDIAVIRLGGFITQKPSLMTMLFGGTSTEALVGEVRSAMAEPSIGAVILAVDSPGGGVFGVPEAAEALRGLRGGKPFIAVSDPLNASAAYYLSSQADEVVATPSSLTGSIGVMSIYADESKALEKAGISVEAITFGRRKAEASGLKPLTEEARAGIQDRVDYYGGLFVSDVAKARKVSPSNVRSRFGEGSVFTAGQALSSGMVDRIATMEEVIGGLATGRKTQMRMEGDPVEIAARAVLAGLSGQGVE